MMRNPLWSRYNVTLQSATTRLSNGFSTGATILIADLDGQVVGFVWTVEKGAFNRSGYIMLIGVDPDFHQHGVGKALMQVAEEQIFANCNDMFLLVSDFNVQAQKFYTRNGYAHIGSIPNYVINGITELIFRKSKPI